MLQKLENQIRSLEKKKEDLKRKQSEKLISALQKLMKDAFCENTILNVLEEHFSPATSEEREVWANTPHPFLAKTKRSARKTAS